MILENKDTLSLLAKGVAVEMHAHHAVQMAVSLGDAYPATLDGNKHLRVRGFVIDSDVPHACQSENTTLLVTSVDAETVKGRKLRRLLGGKRVRLIEELLPKERIDNFAASYQNQTENQFDYTELLNLLVGASEKTETVDERVARAIEFLTANIHTKFKISDVAAQVNLSESRLRHLFAEKVGISVSAYILWTRIKIALKEMLDSNANLSETAYAAGFADHAHFTRVFKRMFGIPPSLLLKYVEFLQVFDL